MKTPKPSSSWFFIDESGDPIFYDKRGNFIVGQEGCSPILVIGFIETGQPQPIRRAILNLQKEVINDSYFRKFPSVLQKTATAFHAKDDLPEIRHRVFQLIASLDFEAQFVIARKREQVFRDKFQARPSAFYDYLVSCVVQDVMHRHQHNHILFAKRGSKERQAPLSKAIEAGIERFEAKVKAPVNTTFSVVAQTPQGEPCLSVIDYLNCAVYRAYVKGEMDYYKMVEDKVSSLVDLYDDEVRPKNRYNRKNPFDIKKTTPL
jgi:hypothetical protein